MDTAKTGLIEKLRGRLKGAKFFAIITATIVIGFIVLLLKETSAPWMIFELIAGVFVFASMMTFVRIGMHAREVAESWDRVSELGNLWLSKPAFSEKDKELRNMFESFRRMAQK